MTNDEGMEATVKDKTLHEVMIETISERLRRYNNNKLYTSLSLGVCIRTVRNWVAQNEELKEFRKGIGGVDL